MYVCVNERVYIHESALFLVCKEYVCVCVHNARTVFAKSISLSDMQSKRTVLDLCRVHWSK